MMNTKAEMSKILKEITEKAGGDLPEVIFYSSFEEFEEAMSHLCITRDFWKGKVSDGFIGVMEDILAITRDIARGG